MASAALQKKRNGQPGKFRIISGSMFAKGPPGCECDGCVGSQGPAQPGQDKNKAGNHLYRARRQDDPEDYDGDIIDSPVDLVLLHNQGNFSRKFERVGERREEQPASFPLERMTLSQLLAVAEEEEVNLQGKTKKDEVMAAIKDNRSKLATAPA